MSNPHNANEELHERLILLLRGVANSEGFSDDDVKTLCYACGIDSKLVLPENYKVHERHSAPLPNWYHEELDYPY